MQYESSAIMNVTARKMKFPIKYFFSKCDQIRKNLPIWSNLPKKSLMENFIFCAVCQLKILGLGHLYSVLYYQKPLVEKTFPKKLIANLLWSLIVSHIGSFYVFDFPSAETYTIGQILSFPIKVILRYRGNNDGILAQILEQRVQIKRLMSVLGAFPVASIVKLNTLVLKSDSHLPKKLFYLLQ